MNISDHSANHSNQNYQHMNIQDSENNEKRTSWCYESIPDEQQLREELIQRATTRLRRRLLEEGLADVMKEVVRFQAELESLRLDAAATIDSVHKIASDTNSMEGTEKMNRQIEVLERRLESHKQGLNQFQSKKEEPIQSPAPITAENMTKSTSTHSNLSSLTALSMSRLSSLSLMSTLFGPSDSVSSKATSVTSETVNRKTEPLYQTAAQQKRESRRRRVKQQYHQYQQSLNNQSDYDEDSFSQSSSAPYESFSHQDNKQWMEQDDYEAKRVHRYDQREQKMSLPRTESRYSRSHVMRNEIIQHPLSDDESCVMSDDDSSSMSQVSSIHPTRIFSGDHFQQPVSPFTPPPQFRRTFFDMENEFIHSHKSEGEETEYEDACTISSPPVGLYPQRPVLEEAMSFLDGLSENGDDCGLAEDLRVLLSNPCLFNKPLSEIESTIHQLRQNEKDKPVRPGLMHLMKPTTLCQLGMKYTSSAVYKATCSSLEWCKFLSVLSAAVVISVLNGPEDMRTPDQ